MRIIFMGTPDFAVPCLEILIKEGYDIVGVITAPDRPAGRGLQLKVSPVKKLALEHDLKILQPTNLKNESFLKELQSLKANLQVVVAFRMLPEAVWNMPALGTINLHGSLLPNYRGAAPINWVIINGEKETGLTTFFIEKEIDTGNIIFQIKMEIRKDETAGDLHDRMMIKGAKLILKTVKAIESGKASGTKQNFSAEDKPAPKIFKNDCKINWNQPTDQIYDFIRGLSPYPAAWTILNDKILKIYLAKKQTVKHSEEPGQVNINNDALKFATQDGYILPKEIQLEGRKKMKVEEFLKGYKLQP